MTRQQLSIIMLACSRHSQSDKPSDLLSRSRERANSLLFSYCLSHGTAIGSYYLQFHLSEVAGTNTSSIKKSISIRHLHVSYLFAITSRVGAIYNRKINFVNVKITTIACILQQEILLWKYSCILKAKILRTAKRFVLLNVG